MNDFILAFRRLSKTRGFAAVAISTLALGIGLDTAMYTALRAAMVRTLPYPEGERLIQVFVQSARRKRENHHSPANFLDIRAQGAIFESAATFSGASFNLSERAEPPERVPGLQVTWDFFKVLGVRPMLGRVFTKEEDLPGQNTVVILDHRFWQLRFGGDPGIVGRQIRVDGETVEVVGVMPPEFRDLMLTGPVSMWRPLAFTEEQRALRGHHYLKVIARLKAEAGLPAAQAGLDVLAQRLEKDFPDVATGIRFLPVPLAEATIPPEGQLMLWGVMGLAGFVLLIACANLANLQFAHTASRSKEWAIRGALGAPRFRLIRQLLSESFVLAAMGGLLGLLVALGAGQLLKRLLVFEGESPLKLSMDWRVLAFAVATTAVCGLVFGWMPAWLSSRTDVNEALKQGARGTTSDRSRHRWEHALIVLEMALALTLLAGAGLMVNGLRRFSEIHPGWRVDGLTVGFLNLPEKRYGDGESQRVFVANLERSLGALPGVEQVALCWNPPLRQFNVSTSFTVDGRPALPPGQDYVRFVNGVSSSYFAVLGMRLQQGRFFTAADGPDHPPVVIINESLARALWPGESPLGQRINGEEIVGVVNDVRFPGNPSDSRTAYQTYRPLAQDPKPFLAIAVRGVVSAETLRRTVAGLDRDLPVGELGPARSSVDSSISNWSIGGKLLSAFAGLGMMLSALGIYGVISGFVARRTGEIGVRMALGAGVGQVLWLVLGKGMRLAMMGAVIGLCGAFAVVRLMGAVLPGLPSSQPWVLLMVVVGLLAVGLLACWIPARRATRVDPMTALRIE